VEGVVAKARFAEVAQGVALAFDVQPTVEQRPALVVLDQIGPAPGTVSVPFRPASRNP